MTRAELIDRLTALRDARRGDGELVRLVGEMLAHLNPESPDPPPTEPMGCTFCHNDGSRCPVCQPD
jgi:hypothetical protein